MERFLAGEQFRSDNGVAAEVICRLLAVGAEGFHALVSRWDMRLTGGGDNV